MQSIKSKKFFKSFLAQILKHFKLLQFYLFDMHVLKFVFHYGFSNIQIHPNGNKIRQFFFPENIILENKLDYIKICEFQIWIIIFTYMIKFCTNKQFSCLKEPFL